jgi:hypothetical protein
VYPIVASVVYQHDIIRVKRYTRVLVVSTVEFYLVVSYAIVRVDDRFTTELAHIVA